MTTEDFMDDYYFNFDDSNAERSGSMFSRYSNDIGVLDGVISPTSVIITFLSNIFIVIIFLQKDMRSPTTCILISIAVSDTLKGICLFALKPYFYWLGAPYLEFPICKWDYYITYVSNFCLNCSVTLTTVLGLQKFFVVQFPFKVKGLCTMKLSLVLICLSIVIGMITWIIIPFSESVSLMPLSKLNLTERYRNVSLAACFVVIPDYDMGSMIEDHIVMMESVTFLVCFIIMIFVTLFLTIHLMRTKKIENVRAMSEQEKWKRRRSIILVIVILIVFVVSEILLFVSHWCYVAVDLLGYGFDFCDVTYEQLYTELQDFSFQIGAVCNLWIYIIISSKFRDAFKKYFICKTK